jgi:hypothetical protein
LKEDAEAGDEMYYKFVRRSTSLLSGFEDEIPYMKNRFYLLVCAALGPGKTPWHHFGRTVDEAIEKCFQQTVACVLAAVYVTDDELEQQLKAGHLKKLPELPKDFFTEKRVEDAMRARERRPTDVPRHRSIREERDRLNRATRAAAGVFYVKGPGGPELVVRKDGRRFSLDRHEAAVEYALEQSPTIRKREEDRGRKERLLALLSSGGGGGVATATTSPDASPRPAPSPEASPRPAPSPEASPLPAPSPGASPLSATSPDASPQLEVTTSSWELTKSSIERLEKQYAQLGIKQLISRGTTLLLAFHVGHDPNTEKPDPTAVQIFQDSLDAVWVSDETDEEESDDFERVKVLAEFERLASLKPSPDQDSYKVKILKKQFPLVQRDVLNKLAADMGFTCCLRHDLAVVEGIILAPKALGVYTFYYPGYWTKEPKRREHHHWIHNLAQLTVDTAVQRRTLLNEGQLFFDKCAVAEGEARAQRDRDPATGLASPHPAYAGRRKSLVEESDSESDGLMETSD